MHHLMFRQGGKAGPARREEATERKAARAPARAPGAAAGGGEPCHLVVLGFPRGGTSLLMNALGEHSQIAMLDEDLVGGIRRLTGSKIRGVKLCVPNQVQLDRAWNAGIHLHPVYRLLRLTGRLPTSAWRNTRPRSKWSIRDYAALPNATFVCLLRDPARSLDAIRRRQGISHEVGARMWDLFIETLTELHSMPDARTVMVSFERLLGDPENQLRALCRQVGIPFETAMLLGPRYNRRYPGQGFDPEKASTGGLPRADELGLPRRTVEGYARLLEAAI